MAVCTFNLVSLISCLIMIYIDKTFNEISTAFNNGFYFCSESQQHKLILLCGENTIH